MHGHNIHSLAIVNYQPPRGETLFHLPLTQILKIFKDSSATTRKYSKTLQQQPENIQRLFSNNPKIFKDFFACKFVLVANQQQPENIQRLFRLQICLSRKSATTREYSKTFWAINSSNQHQQLAAATSSNNQQQQSAASTRSSNQQQQLTAAINSSNQQQQSTAATNSSNQQQQSTAATSSSNQQQKPTPATSSNNQQQQSTTTTSFRPTSITSTIHDDPR